MGFGDAIDRAGSESLMPEEASREIIKAATEKSVVLSRFRRVTMARSQQRMPALAAFPAAYFVDGDTGLKQTTKVQWANKFLDAEEVAVILPIPEAVIEDADYDIFEEIKPLAAEAIGLLVDGAVFFGTGAPASWPDDIRASALAAGNVYTHGTNNAAAGGVAEDINQTMGLVEADGFAVTGFHTARTFRATLRGARATDGQRLLDVDKNADSIHGLPVDYGMPGLWPAAGAGAAKLFAGDWSQFMVGIRTDIQAKILDQAVISDDDGVVILNLAQQDSVALRLRMRLAWQVANPKTRSNTNDATRYPAAYLRTAP